MNINDACKTIRAWNDLLDPAAVRRSVGLPEAVEELKRYLEVMRADGKAVTELVLPAQVLVTPEGLRFVMPFVLSAEAIEANRHRRAMK